MIDVVLADDHVVFLDAVGAVLTGHGYRVVATVRTAAALLTVVRADTPSLCLLDRRLADGDGITVIPDLFRASPETRIVVLTADRSTDCVGQSLERGAVGYVHKSRGAPALVDAIRRVMAGEIVVDIPAGGRRGRTSLAERHRPAMRFTRREMECLEMLVDGFSTAAMAGRLDVSLATVRSHVQSLFTKLGAHSRLEAASLAVRLSLLERDDDLAEDER